ncbi:hypothetical protein SO802_008806 [Lithocarpus litseifolius]|uniref:Uncharacterized protein n=1 Tax=Lithocarpus litseifolius TaxID=425828 RepID=A0AAW2DAP4_9ROSI
MWTLEKRSNLFILTLIGDHHEHCLGPYLINSLLSTLSQVKSQSIYGGSVLITVASCKFFCNDVDSHQCAALLSLPIPTIVVVLGHAAAGELVLALSHDYVLMRRDRSFLYMSEVDLAMTLLDYFATLMRSKIGGSATRCDVLLRGMKVKGQEAVRMGIVDSAVYDSEESVVEAAVSLGDRLAERK